MSLALTLGVAGAALSLGSAVVLLWASRDQTGVGQTSWDQIEGMASDQRRVAALAIAGASLQLLSILAALLAR